MWRGRTTVNGYAIFSGVREFRPIGRPESMPRRSESTGSLSHNYVSLFSRGTVLSRRLRTGLPAIAPTEHRERMPRGEA